MLEEEKLIEKAKKGDFFAFEEIYKKYGPRVFRFIYWKTSDIEITKDLVQEVFLKAFKKIKKFKIKKEGSISSWLLKIARNTVIDFYRTSKPVTSLESLEDPMIQFASSEPSPFEKTSQTLEKEVLEKALKKLPEIQREVLVLRFIEGLSSKEVGKILKKSDGAIRIIQYRALKKLKKILEEDFNFQ